MAQCYGATKGEEKRTIVKRLGLRFVTLLYLADLVLTAVALRLSGAMRLCLPWGADLAVQFLYFFALDLVFLRAAVEDFGGLPLITVRESALLMVDRRGAC